MWKDLPEVWQAAFLEGWEAFKHGAVPIGAVIADENGKIIYTGRNHIGEVKGETTGLLMRRRIVC